MAEDKHKRNQPYKIETTFEDAVKKIAKAPPPKKKQK